jgi:hypothetical protein
MPIYIPNTEFVLVHMSFSLHASTYLSHEWSTAPWLMSLLDQTICQIGIPPIYIHAAVL